MRSIFEGRGRPVRFAGVGAVALLLAAGCNLGATAVHYAAPGQDVAAGDVNGDGHVDLVSVGEPDLAVLLNDGQGGYTVAVQHDDNAETFGTHVALGDVDADGHLDVVSSTTVFDPDAGIVESVMVRLGHGNGTFGAPVFEPGGPPVIEDLQAGDVDGDGAADVVMTTGDVVTTLRSTGGGHLEPGQRTLVRFVRELALADLDGDGALDLIGAGDQDLVADPNNAAWLVVMQGDGTGEFGAPVGYPTGDGIKSITTGLAVDDFDDDGDLDVATAIEGVTDVFGAVLAVLPGTGGAGLGAPQRTNVGLGVNFASLAGADVDLDGHTDLLIAVRDGAARVVYGDGSGGFPAAHDLATDVTEIRRVLTADTNDDDRPDLVFASQPCSAPGCAAAGSISVMANLDGRPTH